MEWRKRFQGRRNPDQSPNFCADFEVEHYVEAQGEKFCTSYDPNSLLYVSKVGRGHGVYIHLISGCCMCCLVVTLLKCLHSTLSVAAGCCYIHLVKLSLLIACLCLPCNECTVLLSDVVSSPDTMQAMDLYDVAEGYPSTVDALRRIKCPVLVNTSLPCNYLSLWYACGTVHRCVRQCVSPV